MTRSSSHLLLALALFVAGCASAPRNAAPASDGASPSTMESTSGGASIFPGPNAPTPEDFAAASSDFAMALDAGASCDLVGSLRDRICALAQRICALSEASPDDATMRAQCEDAASRCLTATEAVRDRCGP